MIGSLAAPEPAAARRRPRWGWKPALAALLAALAVVMAVEPARSTVLEWLGLKSVKVERREPAPVPGKKVSKKKEVPPLHVLGFTLDEIKEARLAPIVDFKGRKRAGVQEQGK